MSASLSSASSIQRPTRAEPVGRVAGTVRGQPRDPAAAAGSDSVADSIMNAAPSSEPRSAIVARLRSAGSVFAEEESQLLVAAARTPADLLALVDRRVAGQPLEHILGWAQFCGLRLAVDPGVFVPRRRTEFLVHQAAALARQVAAAAIQAGVGLAGSGTVVLDMCCGSGAAGAVLAAARDRVELHAADIDPAAVRCARRNLAAAGGQVYLGDLYEPLPITLQGRVDILIANAPYVPTGAIGLMPAEARNHEDRVALDGGPDGLDVLRRVAAGAPTWLARGGHLLVETSRAQAAQAVEFVTESGLIARIASSAELDATAVIGTAVSAR